MQQLLCVSGRDLFSFPSQLTSCPKKLVLRANLCFCRHNSFVSKQKLKYFLQLEILVQRQQSWPSRPNMCGDLLFGFSRVLHLVLRQIICLSRQISVLMEHYFYVCRVCWKRYCLTNFNAAKTSFDGLNVVFEEKANNIYLHFINSCVDK